MTKLKQLGIVWKNQILCQKRNDWNAYNPQYYARVYTIFAFFAYFSDDLFLVIYTWHNDW